MAWWVGAWVWGPDHMPLTSSVTLGKSLNLSRPQLPHCKTHMARVNTS